MNKMSSDFSQGGRILPFDPKYAQKIQTSYEIAVEVAAERGIKEDLTDYWQYHIRQAGFRFLREGKRVHITGKSGFYFPFKQHGVENNVLYKSCLHFFRKIKQLKGPKDALLSRCLQLSIPNPDDRVIFGQEIEGRRVSEHYLRAIFNAYTILSTCEDAGIKVDGDIRIVEIGSGTGLQALVFKQLIPNCTYVLIDLPQILVFASIFLTITLRDSRFLFYEDYYDKGEIQMEKYDFVFLPHYEITSLPDNCCDLAINTDSMQEMNMRAIQGYFREIRRVLGRSEKGFFTATTGYQKLWMENQ